MEQLIFRASQLEMLYRLLLKCKQPLDRFTLESFGYVHFNVNSFSRLEHIFTEVVGGKGGQVGREEKGEERQGILMIGERVKKWRGEDNY